MAGQPYQGAGAEVSKEATPICICGSAGAYQHPRTDGTGGKVWRCEVHKDRWPEYATSKESNHEKAT